MAQKMLFPKIVQWNKVEWDTVPTPGEVYILEHLNGNRYMKVGDGIRALDELPICHYKVDKCCANCEHLFKINRNKIFAVCDEIGKVFHLWQDDTRTSNNCDRFVPLDDGYGDEKKITTLFCPKCNKPMRLLSGNALFTQWSCNTCLNSYNYDVYNEKFCI